MTGQLPLGDFAPPLNPALSQYHTPVRLVRRMVAWAGFKRGRGKGKRVLEPSAGGGNIVRELIRVGASVYAVEVDPAWSRVLEDFDAWITTGNFLDLKPGIDLGGDEIDLAIMNPPLDGGVAAVHVRHALRFAPRVVSIMRGQDLHCKHRWKELWSDCDLAGIAFMVERPCYSGKGGQIETVVVDVWRKKTFTGQQRIEHWADNWDGLPFPDSPKPKQGELI